MIGETEALTQSRDRVVSELTDLAGSIRKQTGVTPTSLAWTVGLTAFAAGLGLAYRLFAARSERDEVADAATRSPDA